MSTVEPQTAPSPETAPAASKERSIRLQEYALVFVIAVLVVVGAFASDRFLSYSNLLVILTSASVVGVTAVGMTYVIATGGIDLSVGSVLAAAGIAGGLIVRNEVVGEQFLSIGFIVVALGFALLLGLVNSLAVTLGRVVPFIATLAMFTIGRGLALRMSSQQPIPLRDAETVRFLGSGRLAGAAVAILVTLLIAAVVWAIVSRTPFGRSLADRRVAGVPGSLLALAVVVVGVWLLLTFTPLTFIAQAKVPMPVVIFLTVVVIGWFVMNRTTFGRYVVATGGNPEAARIAGIRTQRMRFVVYLISAGCAGLAAILLSGRAAVASPVSGNLHELDAIAAVVIGGTSLSGGKATIVGTFLGVVTFALIFNLLNLLGLPAELQQIVRGVIILLAVIVQRRRN